MEDISILDFVKTNYKEYGEAVVQHRALVDFRDGFKPVHRRIIWAMYSLGINSRGGYKKSARVVGDVIGKYHPHGDTAVYDALVNMVNLPIGLIDGQGNFGDYADPPAAMRYTECRLSKFADKFLLNEDYLNVTTMHPNYDGNESEPLYLPSLLPTLMFNGTGGIAVGISADIPPFHPSGVLKVIRLHLRGKKITPQLCAKYMDVNYKYGSHNVTEPEKMLEFYQTGIGTFTLGLDYEIDKRERQMIITGVTPHFKIDRVIKKLEKNREIASIDDQSSDNKTKIAITFKATVSSNGMDAECDKIYRTLFVRESYKTNITTRIDEERAKFSAHNIPELLTNWTKYRIGLEVACQEYRITRLREQIAYQKLMLLAAREREVIIRALSSKTPETVLVEKLDITEEQAKIILDLKVRQLSRLNEDAVVNKIKGLRAELTTAKEYKKNPGAKVLADMVEAGKFFE